MVLESPLLLRLLWEFLNLILVVFFDGKDITAMGITDRAKLGIGFAFQQPVKFKGLTVRDLIELSSGNTINVSEACNYLSDVGLCAKDYLNREVSNSLSGGELKRIEIAMLAAKNLSLLYLMNLRLVLIYGALIA